MSTNKQMATVSIEQDLLDKIFEGNLGCKYRMPMVRNFRDAYGHYRHQGADLEIEFFETEPGVVEARIEVVGHDYWRIEDDDDWAADCGLTD